VERIGSIADSDHWPGEPQVKVGTRSEWGSDNAPSSRGWGEGGDRVIFSALRQASTKRVAQSDKPNAFLLSASRTLRASLRQSGTESIRLRIPEFPKASAPWTVMYRAYGSCFVARGSAGKQLLLLLVFDNGIDVFQYLEIKSETFRLSPVSPSPVSPRCR
jgi:hypothetical protein